MRERIVTEIEERCPCCRTHVEAAQSFDWRYCPHCNDYIKAADVVDQSVTVDHVLEMEDSDMVDDSGIGYELRDLIDYMVDNIK